MNISWLPINILSTPGVIYSLLRSVKRQHKFIRQHLQEELEAAKNMNDGSLDDADFQKITNYYGLAVPAILGEQICALRGYRMSVKERLALTYQGAMTGLGDDFFDKQGTSSETVKAFIETPENFTGYTASEKLFLSFYRKSLEYSHDASLVKQYLRNVFAAQMVSKKQARPGLSKDELLNITLNKGGASVLFYRAAMSHPFKTGEEDALYKIGGLMQFGNDVFDIYKDYNDNIHTLLTTMQKTDDIRKLFTVEVNKSISITNSLSYPKKNKNKCLQLILMSLTSRCYVFFDQLEENEKSTGNIFTPEKYTRKQLVCDMDKSINKWKTIIYFIKQKNHTK